MPHSLPRWMTLLLAASACSGDDDDVGPGVDAGPSLDAGADASDAAPGEDAGTSCPTGQLAGDDGRCGREADVTLVTADGVELSTWVVLPDDVPLGGVPTLVSRTPYNDSFAGNREWSREVGLRHAERGYAYVSQDVRGRPPSTGVFLPETYEIADAGRTIDWIVEQPWSNGAVGTIGGSYLGYTALAAAVDHPAVRVVIADDPSNDETTTRPGGTFWTATLTWIQLVETGEGASAEQTVALTNTFDLPAADELLLGHDSDYWNLVAGHEDIDFWPAESLALTGARTCVPALVVYSRSTGWRDPIDAYEALRRDGCEEHRADVRLVLTPEGHVHHLAALFEEETPVNALMLDYIDRYLGERDVDVSGVPLVQWADEGEPYQGADAWPVPTAEHVLYLDPAGDALADVPDGAGERSLDVDPVTMDPCTSYPYLELSSAPLEEDLELVGEIRAELWVELDVPDADFFVDLYELIGDDVRLVQYGAARASYRSGTSPEPAPLGEPVRIDLRMFPVAHRLRAGSVLYALVGNGACGWFENPLTAEPTGAPTHPVPGTIRFLGGAEHPSRLILPVR